ARLMAPQTIPVICNSFQVEQASQSTEKVVYFVIPSEARNLSSIRPHENKEGFLASLGMTKFWRVFFAACSACLVYLSEILRKINRLKRVLLSRRHIHDWVLLGRMPIGGIRIGSVWIVRARSGPVRIRTVRNGCGIRVRVDRRLDWKGNLPSGIPDEFPLL